MKEWHALNPSTESLKNKITVTEVKQSITQMRKSKQRGLNQICPEFLRQLRPKATKWLAEFFNTCFQEANIPRSWKKSKIIPVLKPQKDPNNIKNCRSISFLCIGFKKYERVLQNRILPFVERELPHEQYEFRSQRSTELQVLNVTQMIEDNYQKKKCTSVLAV